MLYSCDGSYEEKDGKFYFDGREIDNKNLRILNRDFAKDCTTVYFQMQDIGADAETFVALDYAFGKDCQKVYYCDTEHYGWIYEKKTINIDTLRKVDAPSYRYLRFDYGKDKNRAFYKNKSFSVEDVASFQVITPDFTRDYKRAYYKMKMVDKSDGQTFTMIDEHYASDKSKIYLYDKSDVYILPCSTKGFKVLKSPFCKDYKSVIYNRTVIYGADPASFVAFGNGYSRDRSQVFFATESIKEADLSSFKIFEGDEDNDRPSFYAYDKYSVFWANKVLKGANPKSFWVIGSGYATDSSQIYYGAQIVKGADVKTFKPSSHFDKHTDASDTAYTYLKGRRVQQL